MIRQLAVLTAAIGSLGLAGCSEEEPAPGATSMTPDPEVMVMVGRGAEEADWDYCVAPGPVLLIRSLRVDGGVATFGEPTFNSDGMALRTRVSYAPVEESAEGYILAGKRPGDVEVEQDVNWAGRKPLAGASLGDGDYAVFVQTRARAGTALRDGTFGWTSGSDSGTADAPWHIRFEKKC